MNMSNDLANYIQDKITYLVQYRGEGSKDYIKGKVDAYRDILKMCNNLDEKLIDDMQAAWDKGVLYPYKKKWERE